MQGSPQSRNQPRGAPSRQLSGNTASLRQRVPASLPDQPLRAADRGEDSGSKPGRTLAEELAAPAEFGIFHNLTSRILPVSERAAERG